MLGLIPAAGSGTRLQPLAFSKELLPVGTRLDRGIERPRAVSEYLIERLIAGGATRLCFTIASHKSDIVSYYGGSIEGVPVCYVVQPTPSGLCDALFRALPFVTEHESLAVGLPDTIWFPAQALRNLPDAGLSFLCFPVDQPELFDAVIAGPTGEVQRIEVKQQSPGSSWVWGAFKIEAQLFEELNLLYEERGGRDQYVGTLINEYLVRGGKARAVNAGEAYVDVGTVDGLRRAAALLESRASTLHQPASNLTKTDSSDVPTQREPRRAAGESNA